MGKLDYSVSVTRIDGEESTLENYENRVLLVVNTASKCGFTPQYDGLQELWSDLSERGLVVLGFPCDQFGNQEPGAEGEIASFCRINYGVTFPMHAKVDVNGTAAHPLFTQLKTEAPGLLGSKGIKWNFTKFLVARDGTIVRRFSPATKPGAIRSAIEELL